MGSRHGGVISREKLTELLLDDLEDLLLVKLLGQSLNCSQSFTTIALCGKLMLVYCSYDAKWGSWLCDAGGVLPTKLKGKVRTYAEYEYECNSATVWSLLCLRLPRRRGLHQG